MGLLSAAPFTQEWVELHRQVPESAMIGRVQVFDPKLSESVYDPITNDYTDVKAIIVEDKARIQPIRSASLKPSQGNDTSVQTVLFSIPIAHKALALKPWYQVNILASPLNPSLVGVTCVLNEVLDSSNPIERTFYGTYDLES